MQTLIADVETDGFLSEATCVHSLVLKDPDTGTMWSCTDHEYIPYGDCWPKSVEEGLQLLAQADQVVFHNGIKFDYPVLRKLFPWWDLKNPKQTLRDTMVISRLIYAGVIGDWDSKLKHKGQLPGKFFGRHSLDAWGYRLGIYKGDFKKENDFSVWTPEMQSYCEQDVEVTEALWNRLRGFTHWWDTEALQLEHEVQWVCAQIERNGFPFDRPHAEDLYARLASRKAELDQQLKSLFKPWWVYVERKTPKRSVHYKDPLKADTVQGCPYSKVKLQEFNPGSRAQIADRLMKVRGWEPQDYTDKGQIKVDETVLKKLPYPEAQQLAEWFLLDKRLGQLANGDQAWLKLEVGGHIHGYINPNGAVTGRATHAFPNVAQVPGNEAEYGEECRQLFGVHWHPGWKLLGSDQDSLELRCLAGYMSLYDGGEYQETILSGSKDAGTDIHSLNCKALGMDPTETYNIYGTEKKGRAIAKTWFYAFIYGAGNYKLGLILGITGTSKRCSSQGKKSRETFLKNLPALGELTDKVGKRAEKRGYLKGQDGRRLHVRSPHAALNTLLQSAGAIFCKKWLVLVDRWLQEKGLVHGWDGQYAIVAWVHDEFQIAVKEGYEEIVGQTCIEAAEEVGRHYGFKCPLTADYQTGHTWAETH